MCKRSARRACGSARVAAPLLCTAEPPIGTCTTHHGVCANVLPHTQRGSLLCRCLGRSSVAAQKGLHEPVSSCRAIRLAHGHSPCRVPASFGNASHTGARGRRPHAARQCAALQCARWRGHFRAYGSDTPRVCATIPGRVPRVCMR